MLLVKTFPANYRQFFFYGLESQGRLEQRPALTL
jgi:hypothetical protein